MVQPMGNAPGVADAYGGAVFHFDRPGQQVRLFIHLESGPQNGCTLTILNIILIQ